MNTNPAKILKKSRKIIKIKKIERTESHVDWWQSAKILISWFFLFLWWLMLVPPQPTTTNTVAPQQMMFQFHGSAAEWWMQDQIQVHGAADKRGYLFDTASTANNTTANGSLPVSTVSSNAGWALPIQTSTVTPTKYAKIVYGPRPIPNYYVAVETIVFTHDVALYYLENFLEGDRSKLATTIAWYTPQNCTSPRWWDDIAHGDFVIAYQQREDVSTVCNVEKRYCNNWILNGNYTQESCKENIAYQYDKIIPTSNNEENLGEYIQPSPASNSNADFNSQGRLNDPLQATTRWDAQPKDAQIVTSSWINQTEVTYPNCRAPRGEKVLNNQFVKAYKEKMGFVNRPCQVELRVCSAGKLKWTYRNKSCSFTGIACQDYTVPH